MNEKCRLRGGALIGLVRASWPFAKLEADANAIKLNVALIGKYAFKPDQVVRIEKHEIIPVLVSGIRIHHNVSSYPEKIIFRSFRKPEEIIRDLRTCGFIASGRASIRAVQAQGFPLKAGPLIILILLWNILFLYDFDFDPKGFSPDSPERWVPGIGAFTALAMIFSLSVALKPNPVLKNIFLKPGRDVGEVSPLLNLLMYISGLTLAVFTIFRFSNL